MKEFLINIAIVITSITIGTFLVVLYLKYKQYKAEKEWDETHDY